MRIYAVILAAGTSSRLGFNKLTLRINGRPVIQKAIEPFFLTGIKKIFIVTNPENHAVKEALGAPSTFSLQPFFILNHHFSEGMSSSVKAAMPFIKDADAVFFNLGDKPFIKRETVKQMIELYLNRGKHSFDIILPAYEGRKGHPVLVHIKPYIEEMQSLQGDKGLREIIDNHSKNVLLIEGDEGNLFDIDTEKEINIIKERGYLIEKD
jgi:CTP:molybdopterin cytidylyltransferase MocA